MVLTFSRACYPVQYHSFADRHPTDMGWRFRNLPDVSRDSHQGQHHFNCAQALQEPLPDSSRACYEAQHHFLLWAGMKVMWVGAQEICWLSLESAIWPCYSDQYHYNSDSPGDVGYLLGPLPEQASLRWEQVNIMGRTSMKRLTYPEPVTWPINTPL